MNFKNACFVSYCHGEGELLKAFMEQLVKALNSYLEPYLDERVYLDEERLKPGHLYNFALARAICESICMVVVFIPKYGRHSYCLREFEAMEKLETGRRKLLSDKSMGLIIPIILRGRKEDLPASIRDHIHFCDFSKFTTASPDISKNQEYVQKLDEIAAYIFEVYSAFEKTGKDPCDGCGGFKMAAAPNLEPWTSTAAERFPLREGGESTA